MRHDELDEVIGDAGNSVGYDELHVHDGEVSAGDVHKIFPVDADEEARADDEGGADEHLGDDIDDSLAAFYAGADEEKDEAGDEDAGEVDEENFFLGGRHEGGLLFTKVLRGMFLNAGGE